MSYFSNQDCGMGCWEMVLQGRRSMWHQPHISIWMLLCLGQLIKKDSRNLFNSSEGEAEKAERAGVVTWTVSALTGLMLAGLEEAVTWWQDRSGELLVYRACLPIMALAMSMRSLLWHVATHLNGCCGSRKSSGSHIYQLWDETLSSWLREKARMLAGAVRE